MWTTIINAECLFDSYRVHRDNNTFIMILNSSLPFSLSLCFIFYSYHFDLIETLTSLPMGRLQQQQQSQSRSVNRRDRGLSISSQEGGVAKNNSSQTNNDDDGKNNDGKPSNSAIEGKSKSTAKTSSCICGVVSLLECVATAGGAQADRVTRRALRSKHREFNIRAQAAWGTRGSGGGSGGSGPSKSKQQRNNTDKLLRSGHRRCHQPRHLPLPLNPNTRVSFAYELTSIAIVVDASPSLTATTTSFGISMSNNNKNNRNNFNSGEEKSSTPTTAMDDDDDGYCVPLDRLGKTLKMYLLGLIQPIDVPPVAVSGKGVAFGRWTPNLAVTVVAAYPPTSNGDKASAGLLVRDFRVIDEVSVLELVRQVERWALREVEGTIAERLCGLRDFVGDGEVRRNLGSRSQQHNNNNRLLSRLDSFSLDDDDGYCVPLDRLGKTLKMYLLGLIQPIDVPPVAVSGKGVAFGRWTPNLAVTVVAAYPPTSNGDKASAGLLVRDFRVIDEVSVLELVRQVERWALREVEGTIAERLCGLRDFVGDGEVRRNLGSRSQQHNNNNRLLSRLDSFSLPSTDQVMSSSNKHVKSSVKELLAVGDVALSTLPSEGRPIILVASDCQNLECTTTFEFLTATDRTDVPLSVIDLSLNSREQEGHHYAFDFTSSLPDACQMSGGIFLHRELLESCVKAKAGSAARQKLTDLQSSQTTAPLDDHQTRFQGDIHFCSKKRSVRQVRPNALQWYTLFSLSPFTPGGYLLSSTPRPIKSASTSGFFHSSSVSLTSLVNAKQIPNKLHTDRRTSMDESKSNDVVPILSPTTTSQERIMFSKYSIQPVRIKSLLMSRVLEGYRARRYGQTSQDSDKVSIHFTLRLAECDVVLHYEVSFVSDSMKHSSDRY